MKPLECILLVDDDKATNFLSERILRKLNAAKNIKIVRNGKEALEYLRDAFREDINNCPLPDLILLDLNMPLVNGWEFLEAYREFPEDLRKSTVIIMLTTSLRPQDRERAESTGLVSGYINKPLAANEIQELITKHYL